MKDKLCLLALGLLQADATKKHHKHHSNTVTNNDIMNLQTGYLHDTLSNWDLEKTIEDAKRETDTM